MKIFSVITVLLSPYNREKVVFLHYTQDCFRVAVYSFSLKPYMYSAVTVSFSAFALTFFYLFSWWKILCRYVNSWYISVISASGYFKEAAHFAYGIFILVSIYHHILYACSHFLSVSERKSRISSFSISNLFMCRSFIASSYYNWASLLNCCTAGGKAVPSCLGLPLGLIVFLLQAFVDSYCIWSWNFAFLCMWNRISLRFPSSYVLARYIRLILFRILWYMYIFFA